ncbi:MAG: hypothetical protein AAFN77_08340 [Planctomycetota bacterium]
MRFAIPPSNYVAIGLLMFTVMALGCNADPNCRRETALLRAEILDLEDRNAILRARYEKTATELATYNGQPIDMTDIVSPGDYANVVIEEVGAPFGSEVVYPGEIIYSGEVITGESHRANSNPVVAQPQNGGLGQKVESVPVESVPQTRQPSIINRRPVQSRQPERLPTAAPNPAGEANGRLPLPETLDPRGNQDGYQLRRQNRSPLNLQLEGPRGAFTQAGIGNRTSNATEIVINRMGTRGHSVDDVVGDEGLNLLVQTKASNGRVILQPGELTVSLIDPKQTEGDHRIGLWKFLSEETELFFVNDELSSHGILLHLPWDQLTPKRPRLVIHVRFVTPDGRILQTSSDIHIRPPAEGYSPDAPEVVAWTQQDWRWGATAEAAWATDSTDRYPKQGAEERDFEFELDPGFDEAQTVDSPFQYERDQRWQQARNQRQRPNLSSPSEFRRKRVTATPASTTRNEPQLPEPQWRPVR